MFFKVKTKIYIFAHLQKLAKHGFTKVDCTVDWCVKNKIFQCFHNEASSFWFYLSNPKTFFMGSNQVIIWSSLTYDLNCLQLSLNLLPFFRRNPLSSESAKKFVCFGTQHDTANCTIGTTFSWRNWNFMLKMVKLLNNFKCPSSNFMRIISQCLWPKLTHNKVNNYITKE